MGRGGGLRRRSVLTSLALLAVAGCAAHDIGAGHFRVHPGQGLGMHPDVLAGLLLELAATPNRRAAVIVAADGPSAACFLFTSGVDERGGYLSWKASGRRPSSNGALAERHAWLRRLRFQRGQGDEYSRRVPAPEDLGDARLIAALSAFLLEQAYGVPAGAPLNVNLRADGAYCPRWG